MTKSSQDLPAAPTNLEEDEKQDDSLDEGAKPSMLRDERKQAKPPVDQPASLFTKTASSQTSNNTPQYFHFDSNKIYVSTEPESKKYHGVLDGSSAKLEEYCEKHPREKAQCDKALSHRTHAIVKIGEQRPWTWIGCFHDMPQPRAMQAGPHKPFYNTKTCQEACATFKYFALQNTFCQCGNTESYSAWGKASDDQCGESSDHDPFMGRMGRNWFNAVYQSKASVATSLDECEQKEDDRCVALEFQCGEAFDSACNRWRHCGECPAGQWCMKDTNTCNEFGADAPAGKMDMKTMWAKLEKMAKKTNKTADILQFLYPEIFSLEDLSKGLEKNLTQETLKGNLDSKAMWAQILQAMQESQLAEHDASESEDVTKKALAQFLNSKLDVSKMTAAEMENAKRAFAMANEALSKEMKLESKSQDALTKSTLAEHGITDVQKLLLVIQKAADAARGKSQDADTAAREARSEVDSTLSRYKQTSRLADDALKEGQAAHKESQESLRQSEAAMEEAKNGLKQNRAALQTLFKDAQQVETVEVESRANIGATRQAESISASAQQQAQASRYESDAAKREAYKAGQRSDLSFNEASRALSLSQKDARVTSAAALAVHSLKQEAGVALAAGEGAVKKAIVFGQAAEAAVGESRLAVNEGSEAVAASRKAEAGVGKAVAEAKEALAESKESVQNSKAAEKQTKESFGEAQAAEAEAVAAVHKAAGARAEARKSEGEVAGLTGELKNLRSEEEKMMKVIEVLEAQTGHNTKTMDTIEAHENALNSTLATIQKHTDLINETMEWTSALTEGLENHQEILDKHQNAMTKALDLDKKQGEALEKHQKALEAQQGTMNKTVKWVGALSEGMEAHQEALEKHQESLITDLMETAKNTKTIQGHESQLADTTERLESLEDKDAARLQSLNGEEVLYATKAEVKDTMEGVENHLKTAEANMVAINRRTLATKQLATLLHKHTNTLDANVAHMNEALEATVNHGQSNMNVLHTIEANEKEARQDIQKGMEKLGELHHQANLFEQNQNQLRVSAHANSEAVHLLETGQAQHHKDIADLHMHSGDLKKLVSQTHDMAAEAQKKADTLETEKGTLVTKLQQMAEKFEKVTSGSQNKERVQHLQDEADALKRQQMASQAKIDEALKADQISLRIKNETEETQGKIENLGTKSEDIEIHQEKMIKTTAFGLMCVVIAVFLLACFMIGQLRKLGEKIDQRGASTARGSGH